MQWGLSSDRTWTERSSGGVVSASASGRWGGDEQEWSSSGGDSGQAMGIGTRQEWHRYKISRKQLVGITGQRVQADGGSEVLVGGRRVGRNGLGRQWRRGEHRVEGKGQVAVEGDGASNSAKGLDEGHGKRQGV